MSDRRNIVHVTWLVFITHALWLYRWKTQVLCTCWRLERWKVYWYMYQNISCSHHIYITFSLVCFPTWNHIYMRYSNFVYVYLPYSPDLACMYKLFARVDGGLQCIVKCLSAHLRETGRSLVTEEPGMEAPGRNATSYIQSLLDLRDQYNMFLERSFNSDQLFKHAIASVRTRVVVQCMCGTFAETRSMLHVQYIYMYRNDYHWHILLMGSLLISWTHAWQCVITVYMA